MLQEFWQILNKKEDLVKLEDAKAPLEDPLGLTGFWTKFIVSLET